MSIGLLVASCPDPQGSYDEFVENTADMRVSTDQGLGDGGQVVDFSGNYFLAVYTVVGGPLFFQTTATVSGAAGSEVISLSFQPLKTDELSPLTGGGARPDARTPTGDPITISDIPFEADGTFTAALGEITVPGDANPISYAQIVADLTLGGVVLDENTFCGSVSGDVTQPTAINVDGSTFGAVKTDTITTDSPYIQECPGSGGGDSDADAGD